MTATGSTNYIQLTPAAPGNPDGWTLLSGPATVSWTGTLSTPPSTSTASGTDGLYLDDVSLQ